MQPLIPISCILRRMSPLRLLRTGSLLAAAIAAVLLGLVVLTGPLSPPGLVVAGLGATWTLGLHLDLVSAVLLLFVASVGALSAAFATRHLEGSPHLSRYAVLHASTVGGLALTSTAASLPVLAVGWTTAGLSFAGLVGFDRAPAARMASSLVRRRLMAGDALLWAGVLVSMIVLPSLDRADLAVGAGEAPLALVSLAGMLLVAGAAVRSALVPAHRWLPETAEAPTPVSALLHAGLINGVGILGVLTWPLLASAWPALLLLTVLGAASAIVGTLVSRARVDAKGKLAGSTTAQMGYTGVQLGLGLPAAALFHVVGHGLYKASLFLGAGSTVKRTREAAANSALAARRGTLVATGMLLAAGVVALVTTVTATWPATDKGAAGWLPLAMSTAAASLAIAVIAAQTGIRPRARLLGGGLVVAVLVVLLIGLLAWTAWFAGTFTAVPPLAVSGTAIAVALVATAIGIVLDIGSRNGRFPRLAVWAAVQTLPATLPRSRPLGAVSPADRVVPASTEVAKTSALVEVAVDVVGPSWPLGAYVAANPIAGLERLPYRDALTAAQQSWGGRSGWDEGVFHSLMAAGRLDRQDLRAVLEGEPAPHVAEALLLHQGGANDVDEGLLAAATEAAQRLGIAETRKAAGPSAEPTPWTARTAVELLDHVGGGSLTRHVDAHAALWAAQAQHAICHWQPSARGLYPRWRSALATGRVDAPLGVRGAGALATVLPDEPSAAIALALTRLGVPGAQQLGYLSRTLARTPGWTAHHAWRDRFGVDGGVADLLAVRLLTEALVVEAVTTGLNGHPVTWADLLTAAEVEITTPSEFSSTMPDNAAREIARGAKALGWSPDDVLAADSATLASMASTAASLTPARRVELWQTALEGRYQRRLLDQLMASQPPGAAEAPNAQVVTCIDVRSERLRRHLEATGGIATFGYAGFFGVPFSHVSGRGLRSDQCPVLLSPGNEVHSQGISPGTGTAARTAVREALDRVVDAPFLPFALAEALGWAYGAAAALRTAWPRRGSSPALTDVGHIEELVLHDGIPAGFTIDEGVFLVEATLRGMGLTQDFAPLVVLLGHGSVVANNPYASGYDCGACGGNGGLINARVAAALINAPAIRERLRDRGINIPDSTVAVPGVHDTTGDRFALVGTGGLGPKHRELLSELESDLDWALDQVAQERSAALQLSRPSRVLGAASRSRRHVEQRSSDWAQTRPEWGLAGNAAFVAAPRELTAGLDLQGRTFLHSYDADADPDGAVLEVILTAPLIVAQWISSGYAFATLDNNRFGAGDKTRHNPIGEVGVLLGATGDLRLGLPQQAVCAGEASIDGAPVHEPLRLTAVIAAPRSRVEEIVARQPSLQRLLDGEWIRMVVLDAETGTWWHRTTAGWSRDTVTPPSVVGQSDVTERTHA